MSSLAARLKEPNIVWEPQPGPQEALVTSPIFEIFYGGARGGGKSDGALGDFAIHANDYGKDAIGLILRREFKQLSELIERSKAIYEPLGARWTGGNMWRFHNGARLTFAHLDNDADADKYQGSSFSRIYVEEIGNFPFPEPIFKLMACVRSANPNVKCGFRATGNPGGVGQLWIKRRYIDPAPFGMKIIREEFKNPFTSEITQMERVFIPARVTDNKYNNTPQYIGRLQMAGNEQLVKAWLFGDWDVSLGAFFTEWNTHTHVIPQFIIPDHWPRFCSMDWGSSGPFSIGWWAVVADDDFDGIGEGKIIVGNNRYTDPRFQYQNQLPRGALVRYREWYGSADHNNTGLKLTVEEIAKGINDREMHEPRENGRPRIAFRVAGVDLFWPGGGPSLAERMAAKPYYVFWTKADVHRVAGWDQVRQRLLGTADRGKGGNPIWDTGKPMMYFFENCVDSIRTLPAMQHDEHHIEDAVGAEDHAPDDIRYACMSRPFSRPITTSGPDRAVSVGPSNELRIDDVMDEHLTRTKRIPAMTRIK